MNASRPDPLLVAAKVGTLVIRIGLIVAMVVAAIGLVVRLISYGAAAWKSGAAALPGGSITTALAILVVLWLCIAALSLLNLFFTRLSRVIEAVGQDEPFTPENAAHVRRMGWLALVVQAAAALISALSGWLGPLAPRGVSVMFGFSLGGLVFALALFILARVFLQGAAMRDDLQGTV
jgi:hypothetical protein